MQWLTINSPQDLNKIVAESTNTPVLIYKHSYRCSICSTALNRLERNLPAEKYKSYFIDVIKQRDVSDAVANTFNITHESPQLLLVKDGSCVHHASHLEIDARSLPA